MEYEVPNKYEVNIDGTDFVVDTRSGTVREWGVNRHYDPRTGRGYKLVDGRTYALTSYGDFGADIYRARELAADWCRRAQMAWDVCAVNN